MKTITYNLKILKEELMTKWYIELIKLLDNFADSLSEAEFEDDDLLLYPIDLDLIMREKYIILSANKIAYKYLSKLMKKMYELFKKHKIEFNMVVKEKKET